MKQLPKEATPTQKGEVADRRRKVLAKIEVREILGQTVLGELELEEEDFNPPRACHSELLSFRNEEPSGAFLLPLEDDDDISVDLNEEDWEMEGETDPEDIPIWMPSSLTCEKVHILGLNALAEEELELRKGQANDCLEKIRSHLGNLAILYRQNLRGAKSVQTGTRTRKTIQDTRARIWLSAQSYERARLAMVRLGAEDVVLKNYQQITQKDLRVNKDIVEENRYGQGSDSLPWLWRVEGVKSGSNPWMDECKLLLLDIKRPTYKGSPCYNSLVYRVSWLKSRARYRRWEEELQRVRYEMRWSVNWFEKNQQIWEKRSLESQESGPRSFARRMERVFCKFADDGKSLFEGKMVEL